MIYMLQMHQCRCMCVPLALPAPNTCKWCGAEWVPLGTPWGHTGRECPMNDFVGGP